MFSASAISSRLFGGARERLSYRSAVSERSRGSCAPRKRIRSRQTCRQQCLRHNELTKAREKARLATNPFEKIRRPSSRAFLFEHHLRRVSRRSRYRGKRRPGYERRTSENVSGTLFWCSPAASAKRSARLVQAHEAQVGNRPLPEIPRTQTRTQTDTHDTQPNNPDSF